MSPDRKGKRPQRLSDSPTIDSQNQISKRSKRSGVKPPVIDLSRDSPAFIDELFEDTQPDRACETGVGSLSLESKDSQPLVRKNSKKEVPHETTVPTSTVGLEALEITVLQDNSPNVTLGQPANATVNNITSDEQTEGTEIQPISENRQMIAKTERDSRQKQFNSLKTRSSPRLLVSSLQKMNDKQKKFIRDIGFGCLFDLNIVSLPQYLSYWLVDQFDPNKCCLVMANGGELEITEMDVHITLGLPMGKVLVARKTAKENFNLVKDWRNTFEVKDNITSAMVMDKLIADTNCGDQFLVNFIVVLDSYLIDTLGNGHANHSLVRVVPELGDMRELNWCGLVLESLVDAKKSWEKNKDGHFRGPILFLVLLYMDRVKLFTSTALRRIPRSLPVFFGINSKLLRQRETDDINSGGFGRGSIQPRQIIPPTQEIPPTACPQSTTHNEECTEHPAGPEKQPPPLQNWIQTFAQKTSVLASAISEFVEWSTNIPPELQNDDKVNSLLRGANQLLGMGDVTPAPATDAADRSYMDDSPNTIFNNSQHPFWSDPAFIDCLTQIELAYQNKQKLKSNIKGDGQFSFDIFVNDPVLGEDTGIPQNVADATKDGNDAQQAPGPSHGHPPIQQDVQAKTADTLCTPPNPLPTQFQTDIPPEKPLEDKRKSKSPAPLPPRRSPRVNAAPENAPHQLHDTKREEAAKRAYKPSASLRSPYYSRVVDINDPISEIERTVSAYLAMTTTHSTEVLFKHKSIEVVRRDMGTLEDETQLSSVIIDAWTAVLNNKEQYKSAQSPARLFVNINKSFNVDSVSSGACDEQFQRFNLHLDTALSLSPHISLKDIDMFVFGVQQEEVYIMVVFNLKNKVTQIIDINPTCPAETCTFASPFECLGDMLIAFLTEKGLEAKAEIVSTAPTSIVPIAWAGEEKVQHSGVCLMRHMETFFGSERGYKCGFEKGNFKNISKLRVKYLTDIVCSELNEVNKEVMKAAKSHSRMISKGIQGQKINLG